MNVPSGYTALDLVGFTDKGTYSSSSNYVRNDLVHYQGKIWKCKVDDTTNVTPTEGAKWTVWVNSADKITDLTDVNISSVSNNQVLGYDSASSKWKNKTLANVARTGAASDVTYNNTQSGLSATNVNGAIDDVSSDIATLSNVRAELGAHNLLDVNDYDLLTNLSLSDGIFTNTAIDSKTAFYLFIDAFDSNGTKTGGVLSSQAINTTGTKTFDIIVPANTAYLRIGHNGSQKNLTAYIHFSKTGSFKFSINVVGYDVQTVGGLSFKKLMIHRADDKSTVYGEFSKTNVELTKDDSGLTDNQFENGAVNLYKPKISSQVKSGVSFIVNSDNTISTSGTSSALIYLSLESDNAFQMPTGRYHLSGCPSGGGTNTTFYMYLQDYSAGDTPQLVGQDNGEGVDVDLISGHNYRLYIYVAYPTGGTGVNMNGKVFKPMITVADMPNSDYAHYVPYCKSNKELTDDVTTLQNNLQKRLNWTLDTDIATTIINNWNSLPKNAPFMLDVYASGHNIVSGYIYPDGNYGFVTATSLGVSSSYLVQKYNGTYSKYIMNYQTM